MLHRIAAIIRKDALVRFSSRSEILYFLVLPLVFTVVLGGLNFGGGDGDNRVPVLVVDEDGGIFADALFDELAGSEAVRIERTDLETAQDAFDTGEPAMLIIPAGFSVALQAGHAVELPWQAQPDDANALLAEQAVWAAVGRVDRVLTVVSNSVAAAEIRRPFGNDVERTAYFDASLEQAQTLFDAAPVRLAVVQAVEPEEDAVAGFTSAALASAGQLITWVFIPLLGTSALFAYEREQGTLRRLLTTPAQRGVFLVGTISGQLLLALVQMVVIIGFGALIFDLPWGQSPVALAVMLVSFGLAAVALGTTLGTFVKSSGQANNLSIMLGMVMALLGGCWYPLEFFPASVQTAVHVLPTTWAMQGLVDLVVWQQGLIGILPEAAVLLGFAIVLFVIGVRRFQYE